MSKGKEFRELHVPGKPLVLANAWDAGSAKLLVAKGAKAVASSSAAHAFTLGRPDMGHVTREEAIAHAASLADAVNVPVSGDLENGYDDPALTVQAAFAAGLAGCCIEDMDLPDGGAYDFKTACARIEAATRAARDLPEDFVLCARTDGIMNEEYDLAEAIKRLQAFESIGADVLYAPLPKTWDDLKRIIDSVNTPVNVLVAGSYAQYSYEDFAKIGAARLSFGAALARVTHQVILDAADDIFLRGDFTDFQNGASGDEVDTYLGRR